MTVSIISFNYDPLDRYIAFTRSDEPVGLRFYQRDQWVTAIQGNVATSLLRTNHQALAQRDSTGATLFATDLPGSAISLVKPLHPVNNVVYSPYGYSRSLDSTGALVGFNGELPEAITGHYLLGNGHRAYNPVLMRFNSPDSLSPFAKGGINAYAFCSGDPVNRQDPTGRFFTKWLKMLRRVPPAVAVAVTGSTAPGVFEQAQEVVELGYKALVPGPGPRAFDSPGRQYIDLVASKVTLNQPFSRALVTVNYNLNTNGVPLDQVAGNHYGSLLTSVERGDISNVEAHRRAMSHWFNNTSGAERVVGASFNFFGLLSAGPHDAKALKTGVALRSQS
ncbi:RHS repeat-associated core domain-containing protein [Pseudomonas helleri]|uniref:RHS repeat-associated core domain-containing protein n=1 Tax=Pseudomonas helleri TaxID=1608996 RepID=UPI0033406421